jgi:hypothetical protein
LFTLYNSNFDEGYWVVPWELFCYFSNKNRVYLEQHSCISQLHWWENYSELEDNSSFSHKQINYSNWWKRPSGWTDASLILRTSIEIVICVKLTTDYLGLCQLRSNLNDSPSKQSIKVDILMEIKCSCS